MFQSARETKTIQQLQHDQEITLQEVGQIFALKI